MNMQQQQEANLQRQIDEAQGTIDYVRNLLKCNPTWDSTKAETAVQKLEEGVRELEAEKAAIPSEYAKRLKSAKKYWGSMDDETLHAFYAHYTTGSGKGIYNGLDAETSFEDYLIITAETSEYEHQHDI